MPVTDACNAAQLISHTLLRWCARTNKNDVHAAELLLVPLGLPEHLVYMAE
jgi:hypothetical protein